MDKGKDFELDELETKFPEAYEALPDSYKNDSCLKFFVDINVHLCSEDDNKSVYLFTEGKWEIIEESLSF